MDMDFLTFARKRWSVRAYSQKPVEEEKIQKILQAAMIAPTAVNYQPQKIYVIKSDEALGKIRRITKSTYSAPVVFLICADTSRSWHSPFVDGYDSGEMDASIVCTHMMLEAEDLGLGSVWVLLFDPKAITQAFDLPENIKPICLLPVGYPSDNAVPYAPWHDAYRPIKDFTQEL